MGQSVTAFIKNTVAVDHLMPRIREKQEPGKVSVVLSYGIEHFLQVRLGIDGNSENLSIGNRGILQKGFQLNELADAERSPVSPIENQQDILFTLIA